MKGLDNADKRLENNGLLSIPKLIMEVLGKILSKFKKKKDYKRRNG